MHRHWLASSLRPRYPATSASEPIELRVAGAELPQAIYKGEAIHSADFTNATAYKGKQAIIVGSANTAHDIVEDFIENGASEVTMIQRSSTYILPVSYVCDVRLASCRYSVLTLVQQATPLYNGTRDR